MTYSLNPANVSTHSFVTTQTFYSCLLRECSNLLDTAGTNTKVYLKQISNLSKIIIISSSNRNHLGVMIDCGNAFQNRPSKK